MYKQILVASVAGLALAACGNDRGPESADAPESAPAASEAAPSDAGEMTAMPRSPAPEDARVFFITPADGDTVTSPVRIEFGVEGMDLVPAGTNQPTSGHHHLIVDAGLPDLSMPIPATDNYIHYGDASSETELELEPGEHTLRLLFGDHLHVPHEPPVMSEEITITVE